MQLEKPMATENLWHGAGNGVENLPSVVNVQRY